MALGTITINSKVQTGKVKLLNVTFAGDDAYPAGGTEDFAVAINEAITAANVASPNHHVLGAENVTVDAVLQFDAGQLVPFYVAASDKLYVADGGDATWTEAAGDISATPFTLVLLCH
jgi:hypothetical protein